MAGSKRNTLKNTLKDESVQHDLFTSGNVAEKSKKSSSKKKKKSSKFNVGIQNITDSFSFIHSERFHKIFGLTLILFSIYLTIAFISYPFTWIADQDKVLSDLFSADVQVENWLGKIGALLSHIFIYKWFGISSFAFAFVSMLTGLRIAFNIGMVDFKKTYLYSLFSLIYISLMFGYFFTNPDLVYLGGAYGYTFSQNLMAIFGNIGTGLLLIFTLMVFLVTNFNLSLNLSKLFQAVLVEEEKEVEEEENAVDAFAETSIPLTNSLKKEATEDEAIPETTKEEADKVEIELGSTVTDIPKEKTKSEEEVVSSGESDNVQFTVEKAEKKEEELSPEEVAESLIENVGDYDPTLDLSSYQFPSIDLLDDHGASSDIVVNTDELNANKDKILKTLGDYGIEIQKIKATVGPTVTLYEIVPAAGVRISKIKNLEDDIALSLAALGIRIIAPIPGKGTVGIEVPNLNPEMVPMRTLLASDKFQNTKMDLPIAIGKTISNETYIFDLAKMPHLLMAGATGQGKSVGLNAVLVSLLYNKHPSQVKFVLVDPKKVELTLFNKIERHFLAKLPDSADAIITDTKKVVHTLVSLGTEMDQRYDLLKEAQVRNLKEYNAKFIARKLNPNKGHRFLPYIVLVVDEFADLIMTAGKEVETPIARLAQLARAIGIHLIIATQRPSVNIITGTIKANFPARIAFRVTSKIDSRTILDAGGADQLIGKGDMLLSTGNELIRVQCAFVDTPEVEKICDFIGSQQAYPDAYLLPEFVDEKGEGNGNIDDPSERDSLFGQAAEIVVTTQQGSTSLLQRRLKLGYNRAGRIIDQLEAAGIIGPFGGSKAREVLIKDMLSLEQFLKDSNSENE